MNPSLASIGDVLGALFCGALTLLAVGVGVAILLHVRKRKFVARAFQRAGTAELEAVFHALDAAGVEGGEPPTGCVLARTNERRANDDVDRIAIPARLEAHPWAGRTVTVTTGNALTVSVEDGPNTESVVSGRVLRAVDVPRVKGPSGKVRNVFHPKGLLRRAPALRDALTAICPRYPEELLSFLLCAGTWSHEYEPCDQARIGTKPAWVQSPEHRSCAHCGERMEFALQLPGALFDGPSMADATFFVLVCRTHPDASSVVAQLS